MKLEVVNEPTAEDRAAIAAPLVIYNRDHGPPADAKPLALLLKDNDGQTVGGLWGKTVYDWMYVELLAVPESMRGKGMGAALMRAAEDVAIARGCIGAWLDTFAFQARPFYEKLGYSIFGELADHPRGGSRYFLHKKF
ncbi:GNAT family N-acetyltransferase [Dyella psychrodurans]|uniref:GNAT family N-acetyltransferase n=1 Tax=Dyella psychrodurans TaxID=1927960 RepID=UPI0018F44736|nr:GNAT family N-acetyltransferase [Dyella psychrodurans]